MMLDTECPIFVQSLYVKGVNTIFQLCIPRSVAASLISLCDGITLCLTNIQVLFYEVNHELHG
jgi:hypothetical protein